jgi:CBS domain-containing protein
VSITFHPGDRLDDALGRMQESGLRVAPVTVEGRVVGMLTLENVLEYLSFREALGGKETTPGRPLRPLLEPR